jgi:type IV secretory pathway VirB4 component
MIPPRETMAQRRARRAAERELLRGARQNGAATAAARRAAAAEEERVRRAIPAAGEQRPHALRNRRRFTIPTHRATTRNLGGVYLFQAEGGLGADGMLIGTEVYTAGSFFFDPWVLYEAGVLTNPNIFLVGEIGSGKSALFKAMVIRARACGGHRAYVPGDVKGEWTPLVRALGGAVIAVGPGLPNRINPLDEGLRPAGLGDQDWAREVRAHRLELLRSLAEWLGRRSLAPTEHTALAIALDTAAENNTVPLLPHVVSLLFAPDQSRPLQLGFDSYDRLRDAGHELGHLLGVMVSGELAGMFDQPSTVAFDPALPAMSVDISRLGESNPAMPLVMTCASSWMEAAVRDPGGGRRFMVYDEAWRIMRELPLLRRMQSQWKLARGLGISNVAIMHRYSDGSAVGDAGSEQRALAEGLIADTATRIIYRQKADQIRTTAAVVGLNSEEAGMLPGMDRGIGLWRVGNRSLVVKNHLTDAEMALTDTDQRMHAEGR